MILALFAVAPIICSCLLSLLYSLYLFMAYEESGVHHAQEFENRFWTIFAILLSTALFFAKDSPLAFGLWWSPSLGFLGVVLSGYAMHVWDRYLHRIAMSSQPHRNNRLSLMRRAGSGGALSQSLLHLRDLGISVEDQLAKINACLTDIDQLLIPSTINNFINQRFIQAKEREIITVFEECDARALNYLIGHVKLGLLFYKIKDHFNFHGKHRTELIHLLAVERLAILTVMSRVILLHSLQLLKLRANPKAEYWVHHIILHTHQDDLSELKTLTDAKGDYFCMNKLIYDDIRSESIRQDILHHIRREAAVQQTHWQMGTRRRPSMRPVMTWRKVLSDVDDTLYCSGGMYPAGIDKRYPKKTVYPGALAFYRELDLGTQGPEEWEDDRVGNLVFLSARPHVYKDMSEKHTLTKFEKLRVRGHDGRKGMHTTPSLLAGDLASGSQYIVSNDFEPLARKKFDNFRRYVNLYPEYQHVFVCDNGQGDVRAGEMMFDSFPYEFEALYVHIVKDVHKTHGYNIKRWKRKEFCPFFFRTYPEAALHAASRHPPLIRTTGLTRICQDAVNDFAQIKNWGSEKQTKAERMLELNQSLWEANKFLEWHMEEPVKLIQAEQRWKDGEKVRTPYGVSIIRGFDPVWDLYEVELDWRPLDIQVKEYETEKATSRSNALPKTPQQPASSALATVHETDENEEDAVSGDDDENVSSPRTFTQQGGEPSAERPGEPAVVQAVPEISLSVSSGASSSTSLSDISSTMESTEPELYQSPERSVAPSKKRPFATAKVSGRCISKYTPPSLPRLERRSSLFTFFQPPETPKRLVFKEGAEYISPYGLVHVVEYREASGIVVVDMIEWHARAYLQHELLAPVPQTILRSLLRKLSTEPTPKPLEFPHVRGTAIETPFGRASVQRPIPPPTKGRSRETAPAKQAVPTTMCLSIDSWVLADGSHPKLYCTAETAQAWKDRKGGQSILSTLGSFVSSSRTLLEPFLQEPFLQPSKSVVDELPKTFERYFHDAAAVSTPYGNGRVVSFRESDGFYKIALTQWTLANGKHPWAFVRGVDIKCLVANGCQEGYPVLTNLGLSGLLASVEPTTGVHIVTLPSAGMVCYLQPECVVRPLKAAVGEEVLTLFGTGTVERYDSTRDMYTIALDWRAKLYAKPDTFERVGDGIQERDGPFGVNWLLRLLFFSPAAGAGAAGSIPTPRSRSNSFVSTLSQKSKS